MRMWYLSLLIVGMAVTQSWAINGDTLALRSNGTDLGTAWRLDENGYLGTYITLAAPGSVTLRVNAQGAADGGMDPHMNISIADSIVGWDVSGTATNYEHTFDLPAGTHFVRTEFNNDGGTGRNLRVNSFEVVSGASLANSDTNTLALAAADNYIANYRKGNATVHMPALQAGTQVQVRQISQEFNWGTNIYGSSSSGNPNLVNNPVPGTNAHNYQQFIKENFNMVVPSNGGKWSVNEGSRDNVNMSWADTILTFAEDNNMKARMHALVWGTQQPSWVTTMLSNPTATDTYKATFPNATPQGTNLSNIDAVYSDLVALPTSGPNAGEPSEIHERINYYVRDRATNYVELDVYNESYHTGVQGNASTIWNRYGAAGVANIYDDAAAAVALAGADVRLYTNEYSVLENQGGDAYANWYRQNIEAIENGDGDPFDQTVSGVGVQYYSHGGHSAGLMQKALQNLSVLGLPMTLTEFGVQSSLTDLNDRIRNVTEAHRMVFGTPNMTGMLYWGWWESATSGLESSGVLMDATWNLTDVGLAWKALRDSWTTDEILTVGADGSIDFSGFYGDYEIIVGGDTYNLTLDKGDDDHIIRDLTILGDTNGDGIVNIADFVAVKNNMGSVTGELTGGDADGDGDVDALDLALVKALFGSEIVPGPPGLFNVVPEPASAAILGLGGLTLMIRRRYAF